MKNIFEFFEKKNQRTKISMVTCYDFSFARLLNQTEVDVLLVGDSLAMTMYGEPNTLNVSVETMARHTRAVVRGAPDKFVVSDLPFLSYRKGLSQNMRAVEMLMKAGAHAVKLEGASGNTEFVEHLVESGIPVMGHLGLTPQSIHALGGFRVQGRTEESQQRILEQAHALEQVGCMSLVLECVPSSLAQKITKNLKIPTIGIGAGPHTDGQVLVLQDLLGMNSGFHPKFVRQFFKGEGLLVEAFNRFHQDTIGGDFPNETESYAGEGTKLKKPRKSEMSLEN